MVEPTPSLRGFAAMMIREENRNLVLLAIVALLCVAIAAATSLFNPAAPEATTAVHLTEDAPVRVIGTPFVPNTTPRDR